MKLNNILELLNEGARIILATKDAPDWAKPILKEKGFGTVDAIADDEPTIGGSYGDGDVITAYFYVGGRVHQQNSVSYESILTADKKEAALHFGAKVKLWDDVVPGKPNMVLVVHTRPKKAMLYVHPNQMPKQLGAPAGGDDLSDDEKKVLLITKAYISSYRQEYFKKYKVFKNLDNIKKSLVEKKLLTTNGALSLAGKNKVEEISDGKAASGAILSLFGYGD